MNWGEVKRKWKTMRVRERVIRQGASAEDGTGAVGPRCTGGHDGEDEVEAHDLHTDPPPPSTLPPSPLPVTGFAKKHTVEAREHISATPGGPCTTPPRRAWAQGPIQGPCPAPTGALASAAHLRDLRDLRDLRIISDSVRGSRGLAGVGRRRDAAHRSRSSKPTIPTTAHRGAADIECPDHPMVAISSPVAGVTRGARASAAARSDRTGRSLAVLASSPGPGQPGPGCAPSLPRSRVSGPHACLSRSRTRLSSRHACLPRACLARVHARRPSCLAAPRPCGRRGGMWGSGAGCPVELGGTLRTW